MVCDVSFRWVKWNFGRSLTEFSYNYVMKVRVVIVWSISGSLCSLFLFLNQGIYILSGYTVVGIPISPCF